MQLAEATEEDVVEGVCDDVGRTEREKKQQISRMISQEKGFGLVSLLPHRVLVSLFHHVRIWGRVAGAFESAPKSG